MLTKHTPFALLLSLLVAACGGSKPPAEAPSNEGASPDEKADAATSEKSASSEEKSAPADSSADPGIPKDCFKSSGVCFPHPKFVKKLCNTKNPSMALYLFGNGSKWTHGFLTRKTEAWNASGGASSGGYLEFDEEVLILAERKADTGGMQVSGAGGGYDALRWDGSCVTLSGEELTQNRPPSPKSPGIEWRFLDDNVQEALRKDSKINSAYLDRRKYCKGAVSGDVSDKCVKADKQLSDSIVAYLRGGGAVPVPTTLPQ
ncbi:MAG TPA: hypothetical protein VFQ35_26215 [Polyangiaceae bacterium]|nr:hypothetical protein [Polyangiaceae bacterium]